MNEGKTLEDYKQLLMNLEKCEPREKYELTRYLCRTDLFFLLWFALGRNDVFKQWLLDRCKEVQENPNGYLDLWAREHYKSTIITFAKTIQDILASHGDNPFQIWNGQNPTFGIFSCTRPLAKGFLRQIKREFESNTILRDLFKDIIWENPQKEAPKWSEDDGIILKRKTNPKESTVEAWGIVDAQPTGRHFSVLIYDDVVTVDNVRSPNMIQKTTESWELSLNLGSDGGYVRYIGTRYHFNDTYRVILNRGSAIERRYSATVDGTPEGKPVLLTKEILEKKRRDMGSYTFSCQMLLNPVADEAQGFKRDWLKYYDKSDGSNLNRYIVVDPANEKSKTSDYTVIAVIGLGQDENYYLLDVIRDRLNLTQRADFLFRMVKKWKPLNVGYEKNGLGADEAHIRDRMRRENYHFPLQEITHEGMAKNDRIRRLIPIFEQGRFYLPNSRFHTGYDGRTVDLIDNFLVEEYDAFPVCVHDDMLDAIAHIFSKDLNAIWPMIDEEEKTLDRYAHRYSSNSGASSWSV